MKSPSQWELTTPYFWVSHLLRWPTVWSVSPQGCSHFLRRTTFYEMCISLNKPGFTLLWFFLSCAKPGAHSWQPVPETSLRPGTRPPSWVPLSAAALACSKTCLCFCPLSVGGNNKQWGWPASLKEKWRGLDGPLTAFLCTLCNTEGWLLTILKIRWTSHSRGVILTCHLFSAHRSKWATRSFWKIEAPQKSKTPPKKKIIGQYLWWLEIQKFSTKY